MNTKHGSLHKDNDEHESKEERKEESLDADLEDFFQIEVVDGETLYDLIVVMKVETMKI